MSFKTGRKTRLLLTFLPYFAASANELYIFSTMYVYCVYPAMSKQLPHCIKRGEKSLVLIGFDGILCDICVYTVSISYHRSS